KVSRMVKHKRYGKYIRRSTVFKAHDEQNSAKAGDKVLITESRPLSKTKSWKLSQVIEKAKVL
ncbi:MAG: 30S ribosomal protein S17, partial [Bdellovibrionota bacterium]|nr:30S ribosomal protein S17 [Bdellovibrionota bacterium]